jgi:hypothetical protein
MEKDIVTFDYILETGKLDPSLYTSAIFDEIKLCHSRMKKNKKYRFIFLVKEIKEI